MSPLQFNSSAHIHTHNYLQSILNANSYSLYSSLYIENFENIHYKKLGGKYNNIFTYLTLICQITYTETVLFAFCTHFWHWLVWDLRNYDKGTACLLNTVLRERWISDSSIWMLLIECYMSDGATQK